MFQNFSTKKRYKLHFDEDTTKKIRVFCETYSIELTKFVVNTVGCYLYAIEDDIVSNECDLIGAYYDASKLIGIQPTNKIQKEAGKIEVVEVEFPLLISNAIEYICDKIPLTPEEFIEDTLKWSIDDLLNNVKDRDYGFLLKYKDFSKITESINKIYKEGII